ncbi:M20/M25/M40 family metallo-hydrolase [uncultured Marixanthomonas sp.]|uniref:M20/M25/M40 family metallo-hydrolase n=1 Tax=uncultured Marixanthomonas sp. TaxID=757245 RepID=UPI0030DA0195|tara:strand:- start:78715 stop:80163 length:1449 start_codon:yes stop_codon:yes gene_type:complete
MKNTILLFALLLISGNFFAQEESFYATMDATDAKQLQKELPQEIKILATKQNQAAVFISEKAAHALHRNVLTHGPGYVFKASEEKALQAIEPKEPKTERRVLDFTINQDAVVAEALDLVEAQNIEDQILELQAYGTRYHTKPEAEQSVLDLKDKWEAMAQAANRNDVTVRIVNHTNTNMPSAVMTIEGAETPDEFVIIGGHIDSTAPGGGNNVAPGADDDASGISTITEVARVLFETGFVPNRTVEFMAFAAEEIGLVGSAEIAEDYSNNNVDVVAYVQFDMTNYPGSANDVYITTDSYNSNDLNAYLIELMEYYNTSGEHQITYDTTACNYGCSDHFSWADNGYEAAFPFEANFSQSNPNIHTTGDTYNVTGDAFKAAKFAKLGLEFVIETAKTNNLSVSEISNLNLDFIVANKVLTYSLKNSDDSLGKIVVVDVAGKQVLTAANLGKQGTVSFESLSQGFYVAVFTTEANKKLTKKFIVN